MSIGFTLNGREVRFCPSPKQRLLDMLRELGMTSVKEGCSEGECGACTVVMDGEPVASCTVMAFQAEGSRIVTLEGLAEKGLLHPIQRAFAEHGAVQCGFCTPGMIMALYALLVKNPSPTREQVAEAISGNLCRCTGYLPIIEAAMDASRRIDAHAAP
ncbi:aerobic-type carbon monoxide dehydrogenase, small subunit CoxS/CutS-like protein [Thermanaerovibrio velox DSM 12556]|uniref:Aerobic-type carbon monoxide dehydrogenase, small subunit CoxS/CutS-like protein n=1 Tax=Thermanaerovibrio velox DSM 12556 TaxID=926567 RepID=H0UQL8_9BACT|nr:(2Fe-2S)-binding protein [Thermanaerovibrio velox]EHM10782.1 aerobic-type carbon monoxide dehydrogenase, small subunit CoxS/CutS-like protein [Thermanaerovibrio velox DSM 12556]